MTAHMYICRRCGGTYPHWRVCGCDAAVQARKDAKARKATRLAAQAAEQDRADRATQLERRHGSLPTGLK